MTGWRRYLALLGIAIAAFFFLWFTAGLTACVPSLVDVFGVAGLRYPAGLTVLGLLMAAAGCWEA